MTTYWLMFSLQLSQCVGAPSIPLTVFWPAVQGPCAVIREQLYGPQPDVTYTVGPAR